MSWDGPNMEFPEIRGTLFWGPYNKVPTVWGTYYISFLISETPTSTSEPSPTVRRFIMAQGSGFVGRFI